MLGLLVTGSMLAMGIFGMLSLATILDFQASKRQVALEANRPVLVKDDLDLWSRTFVVDNALTP